MKFAAALKRIEDCEHDEYRYADRWAKETLMLAKRAVLNEHGAKEMDARSELLVNVVIDNVRMSAKLNRPDRRNKVADRLAERRAMREGVTA